MTMLIIDSNAPVIYTGGMFSPFAYKFAYYNQKSFKRTESNRNYVQHEESIWLTILTNEFYCEQCTTINKLEDEYNILQQQRWNIRRHLSDESIEGDMWHVLKNELDRIETRCIRIEEQIQTGEFD